MNSLFVKGAKLNEALDDDGELRSDGIKMSDGVEKFVKLRIIDCEGGWSRSRGERGGRGRR